ncbi:hypothetical protein E5K00_01350 [Hymenobacter aquaticus]|uniref:Uncharacterized protein n=1 Tax=Hymenobacter aquaticus TaxID=1867101 RepID=A0A4Z0Q326_9BACT|nr:hypothetical protein [Hymenobacter aquaticus]TGE23889.1 hypothetical protein E5K00_01350 [Hymenobacter aquaticus]
MRFSARFSSSRTHRPGMRPGPGPTSPATLHLAQQADSLLVVADWQPAPELSANNPAAPPPPTPGAAAPNA